MFFTQKKLKQRIEELSKYELKDIQSIEEVDICYDRVGTNGTRPPDKDFSGWKTEKKGYTWLEKDIYVWLKTTYTFPKINSQLYTLIGTFDFSLPTLRDEFEALLYINQKPWHGLDKNHHVISFPDDFSGQTIEIDIRIWSGILEGKVRQHFEAFHVGNSIKNIAFGVRDRATHDLLVTSTAIMQTLEVISTNDPYYTKLLNQLDNAYLLIDWTNPGNDVFYDSIKLANKYINDHYVANAVKPPIKIHCVGHTHIDLAFLWQIKHTREKSARSFSTVLKLMNQFDDYYFFQSQPQLYEFLKNDYPDIYQQIQTRIKEGRWEVDGAMWVEADCNLPSGESFIRQIIYGKNFMEKEFGVTPECLWLPDVFGYSWALPQILKKSGIKYFMTTKISWNEFNQLPHDTFKWKGIDGSEIIAHFVTTPEEGYPRYTYNGIVNAKSIQGLYDNYKDKGLTDTLLLPFGYGDGGGGPNESMLELLQTFKKMPSLPTIEFGGVKEYFHKLDENISNSSAYFHVWDGELYFETHRGTYTSQAKVKKLNRRSEIDMKFAEWLGVVNSIIDNNWQNYPKSDFDSYWKTILKNQFHDIIPGSSIAEVYKDVNLEFTELYEKYNVTTERLLEPLLNTNSMGEITIFNNSSWSRSNNVIFWKNNLENVSFKNSNNNKLSAQRTMLNDGYFVEIPEIDSLSGITIQYEPHDLCDENKSSNFKYATNTLDTPIYLIKWNHYGHITSIYDKQNSWEVLADVGNVLTIYEDKPMKYDAWDIEIFHIQKHQPVTSIESIELTEIGELLAEVTFKWRFNNSQIKQKMRVYTANRRIDFITEVVWNDYNKLLKTIFPVNIRATEATYDIQFGNVKRSTTWNTSWDYAKFESVAHQWADLSEFGYGVAILNDCKYGHSIRENIIQLTLIKSAISPDAKADQGEHQFIYSLFPHTDSWQSAAVVPEAWSLNDPLRIFNGSLQHDKGKIMSPINVNNPFIQIDTIKKAEHGDWLIVRIHDYSGGKQAVTLTSNYNILWWRECDLMENFITQEEQTKSINVTVGAYEIRTFAIKLMANN